MDRDSAPNDHVSQTDFLAIGQITGPHGIYGELKVAALTDYPERFRPGAKLFLGDIGSAVPIEILSVRPHKGRFLVTLDNVSDRNAAEAVRGKFLLIPEADAMPLAEHENYVHDLVGLAVETTEGEVLGQLAEVLFTGANDVYVVRGNAGEILVPALSSVIHQIDLAGGKMLVSLPEGLRD
jgi:16S rRNA processing protein RimM